jgi:DNA-binding NarL/FixJ family response regulator
MNGVFKDVRPVDAGLALAQGAHGSSTYDGPVITRSVVRRHSIRNPVLALSDRERAVLALMAEGRSNAAVAEKLVVSSRTVESHIAKIYTKLGLHDAPDDHRRVLAVLAALRDDQTVGPTASDDRAGRPRLRMPGCRRRPRA